MLWFNSVKSNPVFLFLHPELRCASSTASTNKRLTSQARGPYNGGRLFEFLGILI